MIFIKVKLPLSFNILINFLAETLATEFLIKKMSIMYFRFFWCVLYLFKIKGLFGSGEMVNGIALFCQLGDY